MLYEQLSYVIQYRFNPKLKLKKENNQYVIDFSTDFFFCRD